MDLYQYAKNQVISLFCSRDIFDQKILQFDWPRTFWSISQEPDFSIAWNLRRNLAKNINFHKIPTSGKINDQSFQ